MDETEAPLLAGDAAAAADGGDEDDIAADSEADEAGEQLVQLGKGSTSDVVALLGSMHRPCGLRTDARPVADAVGENGDLDFMEEDHDPLSP
eukprot:jgi/Tetstr1/443861/TSEL_031815.t1